jgi:hypothetical protein
MELKEKRKKCPKGQKKTDCSTCGKPIEAYLVAKRRVYCHDCELAYQRRKRPKFTELKPFQKLKVLARTKANTYLRRGKISKTGCLICGHEKSEMHHDDYSKPLEIKWFCRFHHMEYHKKNPDVLR